MALVVRKRYLNLSKLKVWLCPKGIKQLKKSKQNWIDFEKTGAASRSKNYLICNHLHWLCSDNIYFISLPFILPAYFRSPKSTALILLLLEEYKVVDYSKEYSTLLFDNSSWVVFCFFFCWLQIFLKIIMVTYVNKPGVHLAKYFSQISLKMGSASSFGDGRGTF